MSATPSSAWKGKEPVREKPTTPPRVSFGVELEFLVAERRDFNAKEPELANAHLLPPTCEPGQTGFEIQELLKSKGVPVCGRDEAAGNSDKWVVTYDGSVWEMCEFNYIWSSVELISPPSYAFDEAFDMIRLVVHLITSNFRCRVNPACGFHVHVGNGYDPIPAHAARNFAALWWAAEPLLTMLHPPERAMKFYSLSTRRVRSTAIADGVTAETALDKFRGLICPEEQRTARFFGRDRRLGETPEPWAVSASYVESAATDPGDVEDWSASGSEPFRRPTFGQSEGEHTPVGGDYWNGPPRLNIKCGLPELPSHRSMVLQESTTEPFYSSWKVLEESSANYEDAEQKAQCWLPRPRQPPFKRSGERPTYNDRSTRIMIDGVPGRLARVSDADEQASRPLRQEAWSGVKEFLACDIGSYQVGMLMECITHDTKFLNINWKAYAPIKVARGVNLPPEAFPNSAGPGSEAPRRFTVEFREATGTLDAEWIVTWARIACRLLEWARDADPAEFMRVLGLCAHATDDPDGQELYDVVDLLNDIGLYVEAKHCEERLRRGEEAWFNCLLLKQPEEEPRFEWGDEEDSSEFCEEEDESDEDWEVEKTKKSMQDYLNE